MSSLKIMLRKHEGISKVLQFLTICVLILILILILIISLYYSTLISLYFADIGIEIESQEVTIDYKFSDPLFIFGDSDSILQQFPGSGTVDDPITISNLEITGNHDFNPRTNPIDVYPSECIISISGWCIIPSKINRIIFLTPILVISALICVNYIRKLSSPENIDSHEEVLYP